MGKWVINILEQKTTFDLQEILCAKPVSDAEIVDPRHCDRREGVSSKIHEMRTLVRLRVPTACFRQWTRPQGCS
jgi:hypothetical protein